MSIIDERYFSNLCQQTHLNALFYLSLLYAEFAPTFAVCNRSSSKRLRTSLLFANLTIHTSPPHLISQFLSKFLSLELFIMPTCIAWYFLYSIISRYPLLNLQRHLAGVQLGTGLGISLESVTRALCWLIECQDT